MHNLLGISLLNNPAQVPLLDQKPDGTRVLKVAPSLQVWHWVPRTVAYTQSAHPFARGQRGIQLPLPARVLNRVMFTVKG